VDVDPVKLRLTGIWAALPCQLRVFKSILQHRRAGAKDITALALFRLREGGLHADCLGHWAEREPVDGRRLLRIIKRSAAACRILRRSTYIWSGTGKM
jgi:hypothetical protein